MARIRTIKPEFFTSEQIVECSTSARLLFIGLWCFCDDGGVHPRSTKRIKMEIFPGDDVSDDQVAGWVDELLRVGLLKSFEARKERFLLVTGWHHQKIDRPTLRFPQPAVDTEFDDHSTTPRRAIDEPSPPEGNGRESKGSINTSSAVADGARPSTLDHQFASWWKVVPRKVGKSAAMKAYGKAVKRIRGRSPEDGPGGEDPHAFLVHRISQFAGSPSGRAAGNFCPHPSKWLNDGRYDDDPSDWGAGDSASGSRIATVDDLASFDLVSGGAR